jgi:hypothetical protein
VFAPVQAAVQPRRSLLFGAVSSLLLVCDKPRFSTSLSIRSPFDRDTLGDGGEVKVRVDERNGPAAFSELSCVTYCRGSTKSVRSSGYWSSLLLENHRMAWPSGASRRRSAIVDVDCRSAGLKDSRVVEIDVSSGWSIICGKQKTVVE